MARHLFAHLLVCVITPGPDSRGTELQGGKKKGTRAQVGPITFMVCKQGLVRSGVFFFGSLFSKEWA